MAGLTIVDLLLLAVMLVSVLIGLWRGLVFEVLSLIGWVVAWVLAQAWGPALATRMPVGGEESVVRLAGSYALVFIGVLIAWSLLARLARMLVSATPLTVIDRVLGGVFGALRGLVVLLALSTVLMLTPVATSLAWKESRGAAWLSAILLEFKPLLPQALERQIQV